MQVHEKLYIGGEWVAPAGTDVIEVISPHSEEIVGRVPEGTTADIDRAVAAARTAFDEGEWPRMSPEDRIAAVQRFSDIYAARMMDMAQVITTEMGSPISFSQLAQSPAPWMMLNSFIAEAQKYPWEEERTGMLGTPVIVRSEGVGVVGAIVPWNVPQFVTMSKLAPALLSGSTIVIKPSPETPLDAMLMAELLDEAGIPKGVVSVIPAGREVGEHLVRHRGVDKIAFTGSTAAGRTIASICGEQLKRVSLELGGKSAAIILDDADIPATMEGLKFASLMNNGQACVAQTRILASRKNYATVVDALAEAVSGMTIGDPDDPTTEIGPLVAERQQLHYTALTQHLSTADPQVSTRLAQLAGSVPHVVTDPAARAAQGLSMLAQQVTRESFVLAYADVFQVIAAIGVGMFVWLTVLAWRATKRQAADRVTVVATTVAPSP